LLQKCLTLHIPYSLLELIIGLKAVQTASVCQLTRVSEIITIAIETCNITRRDLLTNSDTQTKKSFLYPFNAPPWLYAHDNFSCVAIFFAHTHVLQTLWRWQYNFNSNKFYSSRVLVAHQLHDCVVNWEVCSAVDVRVLKNLFSRASRKKKKNAQVQSKTISGESKKVILKKYCPLLCQNLTDFQFFSPLKRMLHLE